MTEMTYDNLSLIPHNMPIFHNYLINVLKHHFSRGTTYMYYLDQIHDINGGHVMSILFILIK